MNRVLYRTIWFFLILGTILAVNACKTPRPITKIEVEETDTEILLQKLKLNEVSFTDLSARFSASFSEEKGRNTSLSGQIRILHDSLIWVSVSPVLGIEIFRIMLSPDSVFLMNRLEKSYFRESFSFVSRFMDASLDFDMLQALLLGNDFQTFETKHFKSELAGGLHKLSISQRSKTGKLEAAGRRLPIIPYQEIWLDPVSYKISRIVLQEEKSSGRTVQASYRNFIDAMGKSLPSSIGLRVEGEKNMNLDIEYSKISLNEGIDFPFKVPGSYSILP